MRCVLSLTKKCWMSLVVLILGLSLATGTTLAYSSGPDDGYAGDPPANNTCVNCHSGNPLNSGLGSLQIPNVPTTYTPDSTYFFLISLTQNGQLRWGFELTSILTSGNRGGILDTMGTDIEQKSLGSGDNRDYLKHTSLGTFAGSPTGGAWLIKWHSPPVGSDTVTFYLCGNAANNNNSSSGDYIYSISYTMTERPIGVKPEYPIQPSTPALVTAFPNPFNPDVTLNLQSIPAGEVMVNIVDISGRTVKQMKVYSIGERVLNLPLNLEDLPSGSYLVRAEYPGGSTVTPITKVK